MSETFHIKHQSGTRFTATNEDYSVVTGKGGSGKGEDGMSPGQLLISVLGMCMGVTMVAYCKNHGIPYEGMEIEMSRENTGDGRRLKAAKVQVKVPAELSDKDLNVLTRVAHRCYIGHTLRNGTDVDIDVSIAGE
ncbi:OsmC family protein [Chloroflexota bacterium]